MKELIMIQQGLKATIETAIEKHEVAMAEVNKETESPVEMPCV